MNTYPVTSNAIRNIGYDGVTGQMEVEFHNGYRYLLQNVSPGEHAKFINADSIMTHYRQNFQPFPNDYKIQRIPPSKRSEAADEEPTSD